MVDGDDGRVSMLLLQVLRFNESLPIWGGFSLTLGVDISLVSPTSLSAGGLPYTSKSVSIASATSESSDWPVQVRSKSERVLFDNADKAGILRKVIVDSLRLSTFTELSSKSARSTRMELDRVPFSWARSFAAIESDRATDSGGVIRSSIFWVGLTLTAIVKSYVISYSL